MNRVVKLVALAAIVALVVTILSTMQPTLHCPICNHQITQGQDTITRNDTVYHKWCVDNYLGGVTSKR